MHAAPHNQNPSFVNLTNLKHTKGLPRHHSFTQYQLCNDALWCGLVPAYIYTEINICKPAFDQASMSKRRPEENGLSTLTPEYFSVCIDTTISLLASHSGACHTSCLTVLSAECSAENLHTWQASASNVT